MPTSRRAPLVITLLMLTAVACGSDGDDRPSAAPDTSVTTVAPPPSTTAAPKPVVTLESAGAQPRQPLALKLAAGSTTRVAMVNKLTLKLTVGGQAAPVGVVPATRMVVEQRVDRVDPDGTARYSISFPEVSVVPAPGVDQATIRATQAGLESLRGIRGSGVMTARGEAAEVKFDTSSVTDPAMRATLDPLSSQIGNLSSPFPAEAVGGGARWTVVGTAVMAGLKMTTTTRYTLRSRTGDRYELDLSQEGVAEAGPAPLPNLPAGAQATIDRFGMRSTGQISGDLTRPLPTKSSTKGTGDGSFTVTEGAERTTIRQDMTIELTMEPA